jgi:N utilization substance protein B
MRRRTRARELALQFLYSVDVRGADIRDELETFLRDAGASRLARRFTTELVNGVVTRRDELDAHLSRIAHNWSLDRMPPVARNILRLASFELLHCPEIPVGVALNEAIELGKRYSTANSGAFVNGILDQVKALRTFPDAPAQAPAEHDEEEELPLAGPSTEASAP